MSENNSPDQVDPPTEQPSNETQPESTPVQSEPAVESTSSVPVPVLEQVDEPMDDAEAADDAAAEVGEDSMIQEEPHTSFLQIPSDKQQFTTPSRNLPPLKDIDKIVTPKSFNVAKDAVDASEVSVVNSSPIKNILEDVTTTEEYVDEDGVRAVAGYLSIDETTVRSISSEIINALLVKSTEFQELSSENEFLKLQSEQNVQTTAKQIESLQKKFSNADNESTSLSEENQVLKLTNAQQENKIKELEDVVLSNTQQLTRLKQVEESKQQEIQKLKDDCDTQELENQQTINQLSSTNIEQSKKLNELTKEINDTRNDKFTLKLELAKSVNELSYLRDQKQWFDDELKSVQGRFTELIKKHESEYLITNSQIATLSARNETLETLNNQNQATIGTLKSKLEQEITKYSKIQTDIELEKSRFLKELSSKDELISLTKLQSEQRHARIQQLESYTDEIKTSLGDTIDKLETQLSERTSKVVELQEKLKRTEEVLDAELHKETDLPKLTESSTMIATNGISLSKLYSEYNHLKKQLVLERSQKQKMELQLEAFVNELESKKPALTNYRDQVIFYEASLKDMIGKVETVRSEKTEVEKDAKRLRTRIVETENEMVSMKKLLKDLGRQLCYYLIHSKIRDNHEDPLTLSEKNAIEKILSQTGNFDETLETDSDKLISDRLVEFRNIVELRQRNEELLVAIRQLSKQLESREEENNNSESIAIEEAKDAILTLESELTSLNIKLDAITKERDALKTITDQPTSSSAEARYLSQVNEDLRKKINESDRIMTELKDQSSKTIRDLSEKLREVTDKKNEIALKVTTSRQSAELAESRLANSTKSLEDTRQELNQIRKEIQFWQSQANKQETLLVDKSQELRDLESTVSANRVLINTLEREKVFSETMQKSLTNEIDALRTDKTKLNEFVLNLQSLLKDREESSRELSAKLNTSVENYQSLQSKLAEKEERVLILTSQSELAFKAQNAKLEQVNEISRQLLESRTKLTEKERIIDELKRKIESKTVVHSVPASVPTTSTSATSGEFEINQLKEDLRIAESQVEELSNLAKASETALINATNSFEQYKTDADSKYQSLVKVKEYFETEVNKLTEVYNSTSKELQLIKSTHLSEVDDLKSKLNEFKFKADSYDRLDRDYQAKIVSIRENLDNHINVYEDVQNKYKAEMTRNSMLGAQIESLKSEIESKEHETRQLNEKLQGVKESLQLREEELSSEKSQLETDLSVSNNKIVELKEQNELLLNQLELTKGSNSEVEGDFTQVVSYLRHEKETSEAKLLVANEENQALKTKLEKLQYELSINKSALNNANSINLDVNLKEQAEVASQLEQLHIIKESNSTLRHENQKKEEKLAELESRLETVTNELEPLRTKVNELSSQIEFEKQQVVLLSEENGRLKLATEQSESTLVAGLRERLRDVTSRANSKITTMNEKIQVYQTEITQLKASLEVDEKEKASSEDIDKLKSEIESAKQEAANAKLEIEDLNNKLKNAKSESNKYINTLTQEKNNLVIQLSTKQAELREQFNQEKEQLQKSLKEEYEKSGASAGAGISQEEIDKKYQELEQSVNKRKEELEKEYQEKLASNADASKEITELNAQFEKKLEEERANVKAQVEKLFEVKIKMLNKKVERLEKQTGAPPASLPVVPSQTTPIPLAKPEPSLTPLPAAATATATAAPAQSKPLGYPFTESTLTVHRPTVEKPEAKKFSPTPNPVAHEGKKRSNQGQHQHQPHKKRDHH
ncbi:Protein MLP1 [Spathaspora sp. JA1]|nr:Protein MLP1 [Spathaspora sp. JA1]